jgi:hypothetical protein
MMMAVRRNQNSDVVIALPGGPNNILEMERNPMPPPPPPPSSSPHADEVAKADDDNSQLASSMTSNMMDVYAQHRRRPSTDGTNPTFAISTGSVDPLIPRDGQT